ncbi:phosphoribosylglycinamide formyltransferase [cyanobacterium TDX16]|nr:phosphoribosylglycinamide formyltransferase [cyanobacterium TDX16]
MEPPGTVLRVRIGVLASGSGTLLDAMAEAGLPVTVAAVDRPCRATEVAAAHGIPAEVVERRSFGADFDRSAYTAEVAAMLQRHEVDVVAMAGFGTILAEHVLDAFPDRVLNTHPALLPAFKGWHAVEAALAEGVKVTGCTVHLATPAVDEGPILAQEAVSVRDGDTAESLHERIKVVERRLYPDTLRAVVDGRLDLDDAAQRWRKARAEHQHAD